MSASVRKMLYKGHLKAGAIMAPTAAFIACTINNEPAIQTIGISTIACAASFVTSLLPDLDSKTSRISRILPIMGIIKLILILFIGYKIYILRLFEQEYIDILKILFSVILSIFILMSLGHRKLLHSIWIAIAIGLACNRFIGIENTFTAGVTIGFTMGIISHLWGDMHTTDGVQLLYPIPINFKLRHYKSGEDDWKIIICIIIECAAAIGIYFSYDKIMSLFEIAKSKILTLIFHSRGM